MTVHRIVKVRHEHISLARKTVILEYVSVRLCQMPVRCASFGILQTFYNINLWSLGCAFVSFQVSLKHFLHEMPDKRPHAMTISL